MSLPGSDAAVGRLALQLPGNPVRETSGSWTFGRGTASGSFEPTGELFTRFKATAVSRCVVGLYSYPRASNWRGELFEVWILR